MTIRHYFQKQKLCALILLYFKNPIIINQPIKIYERLQSMKDLQQLDPDWQFAARHGLACQVGMDSFQKSVTTNIILCPCCFQSVYKDPVPLWSNSKQLQFLGFGFPLLYTFIKNCIMMLIISICSYNALALKTAFTSNYEFCNSSNTHRLLESQSVTGICTSFMVHISRIQQKVSGEQQVLRITSFIIQLLFLIYMRDHISKLDAYYTERKASYSNFSIMLKQIPKQLGIQQKIRNFFTQAFDKKHEIKQITLLPEYPQIDQLKLDRNRIVNRLRKAYKTGKFTDEDLKNKINLNKIDKAIQQQIMESNELALHDQLVCQKVIAVFNTQYQKQQIIKQFNKMGPSEKGPYFGVGCQNVRIVTAPQPRQIIWDNVNTPKEKKIFLYIIGWSLSIILLILTTIVFYFLLRQKSLIMAQNEANYHAHPQIPQYKTKYLRSVFITYFALLFIIIFNKLCMVTLFHKFTQLQKHQTTAKFEFSFGLKYCLGLFFTTALMTIIVQALTIGNFYSHSYGVIEQETVMFFFNAFLVPLYWLVNPFGLMKNISRWRNFGKHHLTQKQANILMEASHYDMGKRYAQIIETMWFTYLYSTLIPIGAFISVIGASFYYWVDKYTLLRKSSIGGQVSSKIVMTSMKLLDLTLVFRVVGQLIFDYRIRNKTLLVSSFVLLSISLLYFILPLDRIIYFINPQNFHKKQKTYEQIKEGFKITYHTQHPIYKLIHTQKIRKRFLAKSIQFTTSQRTDSLVQSSYH